VAIAPVAARRGAILVAEREVDADEEDIAERPAMVREERAPDERRLSMVVVNSHSSCDDDYYSLY